MAAFESLQGKWEKKNVAKRAFKYYYVPVNPVRNSSRCDSKPSGALNPTGIILQCNPAAEQRGIISNGVKKLFHHDRWNVPRRLKWEQLKERLW